MVFFLSLSPFHCLEYLQRIIKQAMFISRDEGTGRNIINITVFFVNRVLQKSSQTLDPKQGCVFGASYIQ